VIFFFFGSQVYFVKKRNYCWWSIRYGWSLDYRNLSVLIFVTVVLQIICDW